MIPAKFFLIGGAAASLLAFIGGYKVRSWKCEAEAARSYKAAVAEQARLQTLYDGKSADYEKLRLSIHDQGNTRAEAIRRANAGLPARPDCAPNAATYGLLIGAVRDANAKAAR